MFKIQSVAIDGFWHRFSASCSFKDDVNIIIGKNGTGKTTFMNILHAILAVDVEQINENDFESVEIVLVSGNKKRTVKANKIDDEKFPFTILEYQISQKKYRLKLINSDEIRFSFSFRRNIQQELDNIRANLADLVAVSSLSVYRLRNDDDYEVRDRKGSRVLSPVDYRLSEILKQLTKYQLSLSQQAREVASKLQKDVLASILYAEDTDRKKDNFGFGFDLDFEREKEKSRLISAYTQLGAMDGDIRKKINFHVSSIDSAIKGIIRYQEDSDNSESMEEEDVAPVADAFSALEALKRSRIIVRMSLEAEEETKKIYSQIDLFLRIIQSFIKDKHFNFDSGDLVIKNDMERIAYSRLSSGEKQLIILLTEALLQDKKSHIFLADEPELSLHIEWQRKIIPAVRDLNPNAQVIVATHSPEVAAKYRDSLVDMLDIING